MTLAYPITGVDASYPVPGYTAEILFAQGASTAGIGAREVVFVMPKLSTGTWTAGTLYRVRSSGEAETGAGPGSPLHRGIRKFLQSNKNAKIWALPVAETVTGSPTAATATITYVGNATATGTATATVCGEDCSYTFLNGETITQIAAGLTLAINAKTWLPVTAGASTGVVTLTAKLKGISQGTASLGVIRCRAVISSGVTTTSTISGAFLGSAVAGAEGTTTESANMVTALLAIDSVRKYFIVTSLNSAVPLAALKTHISVKAEPIRGVRAVGIAAYTGSLATGQTLITANNYERMQIAFQPNSEHDCAELAGAVAAMRQAGEALDPARNFNRTRMDTLLPVYASSDRVNADDTWDAMTDGLTVIGSDDSGAFLVSSLTARSKNAALTAYDRRAARSNKVSVADAWTDDFLLRLENNFGQKKLLADELLADGTVNANQSQIDGVVRPSMIKGVAVQLLDEYASAGRLKSVALSKAAVNFLQSSDAPNRVEGAVDLYVIDWLDQITSRVSETSAG